ncbi:hypothetical protein QYE76_015034 [Lolium multiflorum]|uniref:DUF6598 domain-containing protein n=1 Tax=Lolium multiflorum TaxID=4521 RepID=A0AAD8U667_LOLMU|nr:hypothetical protein QYE76_015034 [Lolium multiflorum]
MDHIGKSQAKTEGESSSSGAENVPMIQDSRLKSKTTVEDPFPGFLLDFLDLASADDDDNKEDILNGGKSAEQIANEEEMAREDKEFASHRRCWEDLWEPTYGYFKDKNHVKFEVQLRLKGTTESQDRALIRAFCDYTGGHYPGVSTTSFENCFCTTELCLERIEQTVQATILSVRVKNGPWPFEYGGEVACFAPSYNTAPSSMNVVLLSSRGRPMPNDLDGYLHLSRNVVSVELKGSLTFFVHAYSHSGEITAQGQVCFMANKCSITQQTCFFHDPEVEVEITVAWSTLVSDKRRIASQGWML